MTDKVLGVLGGMGPLASAQFMLRLTLLTPAERDQDHIPAVLWSDPRVPDRTAARLGAEVVAAGNGSVDLTVVGSQIGAPMGRIALGGATRNQLDSATSAVLVLPRGVAVTL